MSTKSPTFQIRPARPVDRRDLVALHRALYERHRDTLMSEETKRLYAYRDFHEVLSDDVDAMLRNPATALLLAERDERVIGYITGYIELDKRRILGRKGVVGDWYVLESERGLGVGRALLGELIDVFQKAACNIAEIATWPTNHGTRRFIEAAGFEEVQIVYRQAIGDER